MTISMLVVVISSVCLLPVLNGESYKVGTPPVCTGQASDCEDVGDRFMGYDQEALCTYGQVAICEKTEDVSGQIWIGTSPFCDTSASECSAMGLRHIRSDKCGDGACCWLGRKQLCAPQTQLKRQPKMWLGHSPVCTAKWYDCHFFSMQHRATSDVGDGSKCAVGKKVLCASPVPDSELTTTSPHHFTALTYNVFELPFIVTHSGQRERTCRIPRNIRRSLPDTDVIVFNELFRGGCWPGRLNMVTLLRQHGFPFATQVLAHSDNDNDLALKVLNGGVLIASRWPIVHTEYKIFDSHYPLGSDFFAKKGVVYVKVVKFDADSGKMRLYHVFGTHLQSAQGSLEQVWRLLQASELGAFIEEKNIPSTEAVIIAGDLNVDMARTRDLRDTMRALHADLPERVGSVNATYHSVENPVVDRDEVEVDGELVSEWLDYVLTSTDHLQPVSATMEAVRLQHNAKFAVCSKAPLQPIYAYPHSVRCAETTYFTDLSDHYPVIGRFTFPEAGQDHQVANSTEFPVQS